MRHTHTHMQTHTPVGTHMYTRHTHKHTHCEADWGNTIAKHDCQYCSTFLGESAIEQHINCHLPNLNIFCDSFCSSFLGWKEHFSNYENIWTHHGIVFLQWLPTLSKIGSPFFTWTLCIATLWFCCLWFCCQQFQVSPLWLPWWRGCSE